MSTISSKIDQICKQNYRVIRCHACEGTGYILIMGEETCVSCAGLGRDLKEDMWMGYCSKCGGKGRVPYCRRSPTSFCPVCRGNKVVEI